ncbi:metal regulatory transcription factor 1-like [Agrilus planipennis]|uniref:Metal regulatory transcription factor 1-like n=1 Tax=Agrilus planipennis TaxID=224129 RepID=A0A1W4X2J2_AGRPL|nr:metal regulatory transcription factor 1-like [Agrilus planipennis]
MNRTPKRSKLTSETSEPVNATPPNKILRQNVLNSIERTPVNGSPKENSVVSPSETRRGRPRAEFLNTLILEGSTSPSSIKCTYCSRVFPREKSLQAHLRTHTGERPYACDYPKCTRRFTQSGQLKTHQRLHTGEKPFVCTVPNCERRFTHANRHCPEHPEGQLKRFSSITNSNQENKNDEEHSTAVQNWLRANRRCLNNKENTKKKSRFHELRFTSDGENGIEQNENLDLSNSATWSMRNSESSTSSEYADNTCTTQSSDTSDFAHSSQEIWSDNSTHIDLQCQYGSSKENITNVAPLTFKEPSVQQLFKDKSESSKESQKMLKLSNGPAEPVELPKKRWLREAVQDQRRWDSQELAKPLNWEDMNIVEYENQRRPTVLMRVQDCGEKKEISRADMQTAIALVELKNGGPINYTPF